MKLLRYFDAFLENTVNLNKSRLDELNAHVDALVVAVGLDDAIGPIVVEHIPQGSWAHRTIIKPLPEHEFDADILLQLEEQPSWEENPRRYINEVNSAFGRTRYKDMLELHTRCVRVIYANNCHVDVVPYVVRADGSQVIVNRRDNAFEETNPQGFTDWMKEKDDLALRNLRRVIRLMKYLRDYKGRFEIPSVILTTFLGERVQSWQPDERYADVPTALVNLVSDLDQWLQLYDSMPIIEDPSCPGTTFNHRWTQARYAIFRDRINRYAEQVDAAYHEDDRDVSLKLWQDIFGPDFKAPATLISESAQAAIAASAKAALAKAVTDRAPKEELIEERGYTWDVSRRARIDARVRPMAGFRDGPLRKTRIVGKNRTLQFSLTTDTPSPFEVWWKIRNRGEEAAQVGALRGEIRRGSVDAMTHREPTAYRGRHSVEAYVVKDGRVVATDRHDVVIE